MEKQVKRKISKRELLALVDVTVKVLGRSLSTAEAAVLSAMMIASFGEGLGDKRQTFAFCETVIDFLAFLGDDYTLDGVYKLCELMGVKVVDGDEEENDG